MPKPTMSERFLISCEAEPAQMGGIIAQLTRMGLTNIKFELIADVRSFARNAPPKDGVSSSEFLRKWIESNPTFKAIDAVNHFRADGRSSGAAYPALSALVDEGVLNKLGPGAYSRADVKHIAGPKKKAKPAKVAHTRVTTKPNPTFKVNSQEALLSIGRRNHGRFTAELAKKHFAVQGRAPAGVGPTISNLLKDKMIKRTETGSYELTAKGSGGKLKANGAMPSPVEPVADAPAAEA